MAVLKICELSYLVMVERYQLKINNQSRLKIFTRTRSDQKWSTDAIPGLEITKPHFPALSSKLFTRPCGWWLIFHSAVFFPGTQCPKLYWYFQVKCSDELHVLMLDLYRLDPACYIYRVESVSFTMYSIGKTDLPLRLLLPKNRDVVEASLNITILSSSSLGPIVMYPSYFQNFHVLFPLLLLISHTSFGNPLHWATLGAFIFV